MEPILLVAVVVLVVLHLRLNSRVRLLEEALDLRPVEEPPRARVAEPAAPAAPPHLAEPTPVESEKRPEPDAASTARAAPRTFAFEHFVGQPQPDSREAEPAAPALSLGALFELFVGGRLLIWIGGIALAVAGIFMVRFSAGLITPAVRMVLAALFGLALLAAGELARGRPGAVPDPRVPQALVGAGILVLYAAPYGAFILYHLISTGTASTLMVVVTAAALVLSLRHGPPAGVLGLVGGFATPLLVGDPNAGAIPLLFYLALLDIALFAIASRRGWTWLAAAAVLLSLVWSGTLLGRPHDDALAAGAFALLLSVAASLVRPGPGWQLDFLRPAALGLLELAVLVGRTDLGLPAWGLFGTLSIASFLLAARRQEYRPIPAFALGLALVLIAIKSLSDTLSSDNSFLAAAGATLIFAGGAIPFVLKRDGRLLWMAIACGACAGPVLELRLLRTERFDLMLWGALMLALAILPLLLAWASRRDEAAAPRMTAAGTVLLLASFAMWDLLPHDLVPAAWMVLGVATAFVAESAGDRKLARLALVAAAAALALAALRVAPFWTALFLSLGGVPPLAAQLPGALTAVEALALPGLLLLVLIPLLSVDQSRAWLLGAALFCLTASLYLLFKQAWGLADARDFVARGFAERLVVTQFLFAVGWFACRLPIPALATEERRRIGTAFVALAAARLLWFDLLIDNPVMVDQSVGPLAVLNLVLPAYLLSAAWLYSVRRTSASELRSGIWLALFLAALIFGVMLLVRQYFQGPILTAPDIPDTESYFYSLAGLLLSLGLLIAGIRLPDKALRVAGLALLTATTIKVFGVDASALEGVLRILSFLALGIALIGIGKLYTKVLDAERAGAAPATEAQ